MVFFICNGFILSSAGTNLTQLHKFSILLFVLPAYRRGGLVVRFGLGKGVCLKPPLLIDGDQEKRGLAASSDLVLVNKKTLGVLYERNGYREILFAPIQLKKDFQPWKK